MWIMLPDGFLSIVDKARSPGCLVVRARVREHLVRVFPHARVEETPGNDYLFRAEVPRGDVALALAGLVEKIDYPNHKGATADRRLHDAYSRVWGVMAALQRVPPYAGPARRPGRQARLL